MFNHQYNFNIELPKEVLFPNQHTELNYKLLDNKIIIGCSGYARSGKDTVAKQFVEEYGFHRVAFADNLKVEMNKFLKEIIYNYLRNIHKIEKEPHLDVKEGLLLDDGRTLTLDMIDFQTEDQQIKKRLRPFIIWCGEKVREINGSYYWINQSFKIDASGHDKIILSDVRRPSELEIFEDSNSFNNRTKKMFATATCYDIPQCSIKTYSTLLFHVSQYGLQDKDVLTLETIRIAQEKWLFDDTFHIDSRLPEEEFFRFKAIKIQVNDIAKKFGIQIPDKTISIRQIKMFL